MIYMNFDPTTGLAFKPGVDCDPEAFRNRRDDKWMFNPWTGWRRSPEDINRDPQGRSIDPYCLTCGGTDNHKPGCPDAPKVSAGQHWRNHATGTFGRVVSVDNTNVLLEYKDGRRRFVEIAKLPMHWSLVPDRYLTDCVQMQPPTTKPSAVSAPDLLDAAAGHMRDRAKTYDKPEGERSMAQTVAAFNAITGRTLTESEGWLLMQILKDVRDRARQDAHRDSLEDGIAYSALKAEARLAGK